LVSDVSHIAGLKSGQAALNTDTRNLTPKQRNKNGIKVKGSDKRISTTIGDAHPAW
jgi:hypothetical protein